MDPGETSQSPVQESESARASHGKHGRQVHRLGQYSLCDPGGTPAEPFSLGALSSCLTFCLLLLELEVCDIVIGLVKAEQLDYQTSYDRMWGVLSHHTARNPSSASRPVSNVLSVHPMSTCRRTS